MNKQELIKKYEGEFVSIGMNLSTAIKFKELWVDILELDEPQKPVVPQFVVDWYEEHKDDFEIALFRCIDHIPSVYDEGDLNELEEWIIDGETKPFQTLVNMHQFGYTVEKEKRYLVKMKNLRALFCYLAYIPDEGYWSLMASGGESIIIKHTRKELEEAGFGEVFDSPLFEVEEVEE
ncbi:MAG: DUF1642 domain-containing protein [Streptococcus salivarius]|nr:DUF1642 domain-containing protein [Streptococcus salivarius]